MFFRNNHTEADRRPNIEYVPMSLAELKVFERVVLTAERAVAANRFDINVGSYKTELIGALYQRAGAASVHTTDPARVRIPVQRADFLWLETAVRDLEKYRWQPDLAEEGRQLLWRLHALLGRERAVIHAGGTPMFDPDHPAAVVVDDDGQAVPARRGELPTGRREH